MPLRRPNTAAVNLPRESVLAAGASWRSRPSSLLENEALSVRQICIRYYATVLNFKYVDSFVFSPSSAIMSAAERAKSKIAALLTIRTLRQHTTVLARMWASPGADMRVDLAAPRTG